MLLNCLLSGKNLKYWVFFTDRPELNLSTTSEPRRALSANSVAFQDQGQRLAGTSAMLWLNWRSWIYSSHCRGVKLKHITGQKTSPKSWVTFHLKKKNFPQNVTMTYLRCTKNFWYNPSMIVLPWLKQWLCIASQLNESVGQIWPPGQSLTSVHHHETCSMHTGSA